LDPGGESCRELVIHLAAEDSIPAPGGFTIVGRAVVVGHEDFLVFNSIRSISECRHLDCLTSREVVVGGVSLGTPPTLF